MGVNVLQHVYKCQELVYFRGTSLLVYKGAHMATYGYCRVSTDRQAQEGESLGAQERTIQGYAMMHGLKVDKIFVEGGVSGSKPLNERPEGKKLLDVLQAGDVVITAKLDRMFRSALDALAVLDVLQKQRVSLHMIDLGGDVTNNGISKLFFTIISAVAEAERDRIRERVQSMKRDQKTRQRYLGGEVPFGFERTAEGALIENPIQQEVIFRMCSMQESGISLRRIASAVNNEGFQLSHMGVKKIIQSAAKRKTIEAWAA